MLGKILLTSWLVAFPAVAMADVRVDFDRHKDFSKYRTFDVEIGTLVRPDGSIDEQNTLAENRIRNAVTSELLSRGLEPSDEGANLVVRVSARDTERVSVMSTGWPTYYSGYWHRRWGYWGRPYRYGYWGAPYYGEVWTRRYIEGALTVDIIDRQTDALVYRAQVTDEVGKDLDKQVAKSIDKAFKKFPVKELERLSCLWPAACGCRPCAPKPSCLPGTWACTSCTRICSGRSESVNPITSCQFDPDEIQGVLRGAQIAVLSESGIAARCMGDVRLRRRNHTWRLIEREHGSWQIFDG